MPPDRAGKLDTLIDIGAKVEKIIGVWMPHVRVGIELVKFFVNKHNAASPADPIDLPSDAELIQQLKDRADRIVATGEDFLNRPPEE